MKGTSPALLASWISRTCSIFRPAIVGTCPGALKMYHIFSRKMSVLMCMPVPAWVFSLALAEG